MKKNVTKIGDIEDSNYRCFTTLTKVPKKIPIPGEREKTNKERNSN